MERVEPRPDQESVWDYPRPPKLEPTVKHVSVYFNGELIADSRRAWRVLETSHPPVYYVPPEDVRTDYLTPSQGSSWCEWKGQATYFDIVVGEKMASKAAWSYPKPTPSFAAIKDHVAFYAGLMDRCQVDGEEVSPQPGGFYGGWIIEDIVGPFKGEPGTSGW
jgi:uncharacterized protein (DUF427 family)